MNLSLTPLNEAYNIPKLKHKTKTNVHTDSSFQKEMLTKSSMQVHENLPDGYSSNTEHHSLNFTSDIKSEIKKLSLTITDPELISMLSIYKEDYISVLFKDLLKNKKPNTTVETFTGNSTVDEFIPFDINILLAILIFLLIADIILRLKYK